MIPPVRTDEADDGLSDLSAHLRELSTEERQLRTEVRHIIFAPSGSGNYPKTPEHMLQADQHATLHCIVW